MEDAAAMDGGSNVPRPIVLIHGVGGAIEHKFHVRNTADVPSSESLIKRFAITEHRPHVRHRGCVPQANFGVKPSTTKEPAFPPNK